MTGIPLITLGQSYKRYRWKLPWQRVLSTFQSDSGGLRDDIDVVVFKCADEQRVDHARM